MRPPSHKLGAGEDIDNYTRHFVPFPISTFALCSVHRTSVIKRPTVDYCVILKKGTTPCRTNSSHQCTVILRGRAWYVNRKDASWGQEDMMVERWDEGCYKGQEIRQEEMGNVRKSGRERDVYKQANKEEKKTEATLNVHSMDEVYKELETPKGERNIYRIAKARDKSANDFTQIRRIKDEQGVVRW